MGRITVEMSDSRGKALGSELLGRGMWMVERSFISIYIYFYIFSLEEFTY